MVRTIQIILVYTFILGLCTFTIVYLLSNWRINKVGRYIMYFFISICVFFLYLVIAPLVRNYPGKQIFDTILLLGLNVTSWRVVWLLFSIRKNGKVKDDEDIRRRQDSGP